MARNVSFSCYKSFKSDFLNAVEKKQKSEHAPPALCRDAVRGEFLIWAINKVYLGAGLIEAIEAIEAASRDPQVRDHLRFVLGPLAQTIARR